MIDAEKIVDDNESAVFFVCQKVSVCEKNYEYSMV